MSSIKQLARPHLHHFEPYSSARDEFTNDAQVRELVYLDANENPFGPQRILEQMTSRGDAFHQIQSALSLANRYPDPHQKSLRQAIARLKGVLPSEVFVGNGSDEAIELLIKIFCEPGKDFVVSCPPTYGMYQVSAKSNAVALKHCPLQKDFSLDLEALGEIAKDPHAKLLFLCSPNNPTGQLVPLDQIERVAKFFPGIVVVDEAYIDFAPSSASALNQISKLSNLVVLQTLSKAWGLAALRVGIAFANKEIIELIDSIKQPYNVNGLSQQIALYALTQADDKESQVGMICKERDRVLNILQRTKCVLHAFPSSANFLLVRFDDGPATYRYLLEKGIIVRDRSSQLYCDNCLRITIGTPDENDALVAALGGLQS